MKKGKVTLTMQLVIIVSAILLIGNVLVGLVLLNQSRESIKTIINARMLDIANTAAAMLDGDIMEHISPEDEGTEEYESQMNNLRAFQDAIELKYIYCINDEGNKHFTFSIDPTVLDPAPFGDDVVYTDALYEASLGTPSVDDEPYVDEWGSFYSAYSPVFNSKGEVATIVAVDFSTEWYEKQIRKFAETIFISVIVTIALGIFAVTVVMSGVRKHFRDMNLELIDLTKDIDDITREIAVSAAVDRSMNGFHEKLSIESEDDTGGEKAVEDAIDDIQALGEKVHYARGIIREYIDHAQRRANNMITALAADYRSVYYVNLDTDSGVCYRAHSKLENGLAEGEDFIFSETFTNYANEYVDEKYREGFLKFIDPDNIRKSLETQQLIAYRYLVSKDGKESYEMLRMAGVRKAEDRDDHMIHSIGVGFTDVDAEMRESLERSQALSDALAVAEEASKAKTVFLSNMSHEIRTPMNAIIGLDKIALSDTDISDRTREYLEQIGSSAGHLLKIINDILDMSRIESGRMVIKNEEFSFTKLLEQVNTIIGTQCSDKGIYYNCEVLGEIDNYYIGDDMKLKQVLINILGNSVKFTERGGNIGLTVEKTAGFYGKSTLKFVMKDDGVGMDKEFIPKIFDAFSQEDSSTTNKYGSTGLGMAITKRIVEMMNGAIEVESTKGEGTTFVVSVTLLDSDRKDSDENIGEINPHETTVLIIDDDQIACEHAHVELEKVGIVSEIASSGKEAIEMVKLRQARREPYSLILVDLKMPEMDGIETTKKLREVIGDDSAIIILTSQQWEDVLDEAISAGADSFASKPLNTSFVLEQFKEALIQKNIKNSARTDKANLEGRRVLLAEDIKVNAKIMQKVLSMRNIEADHAENGRIAVELFKSHPEWYYDAILMDMRMPEMDGLQATMAIRALDRADSKKIPIIALTANAFDEDVQRSLQAGLNAHLSKPVEPDVVFDTLESLIKDDDRCYCSDSSAHLLR
ncbi:hybrid sensor histidine kinase/response regulator [Butyrivibrio sp. WCE2006]|uniref:hybrid sensor histidine kinase/response regulator n=1 Tax=Butyrivibrio sp. WCE2006 TaxID=1410611 RepID=UPI0006792C29|nr:response regulator [Butyrivibrio sp. WCE2006]